MEMICAIVRQLTQDLTPEEIQKSGFDTYYVDHTLGLWPAAASGIPHNACEYQSKGDPITDLFENMAAEQKARTTYDNILRLVKDPEVCDPIRFLRLVTDRLYSKNFYAFNPAFDAKSSC